MATAPHSPPDPHYEPEPRYGHCSALVEGKWITYGGVGADGGFADPPTSIDVFDPDREEWTQMTTSGTPPSGVGSAACVAVGPLLYHIGGADEEVCYNTVHCLDTTTMEWRELHPANPQAAPMKKSGLAGISYGSIIVTVGGRGELPINCHPGVEYVPRPESEGEGWTNEVVCYDTEQHMWFRSTITGSPPPACQLCSLTRVDHHRAVLFGGEGKDEPVSPDVYILDMNHWTWTAIPASQTPNHPVARVVPSSISVYDPDADSTHPALLIMWGSDGEMLRDSWIFHLNQQQWKQVILPETLKGRAFHASVIIHSSPKIRIICFGGINDWPEDDDTDKAVPIAQTTVVELSCSGGHPAEWIVTDVSQLGEGDRLPTHIKLTMEEEMRHLTICERIMSEKGEVNLNFALCLLNGPPRVGKSTFLSRITGRPLPRSATDEYLISETPSTGVAERVLQVVIKKSSFTIALAPQSPKPPQAPRSEINWQIITLSQEAVVMLKAILSSQPTLALEQLESQMPPTSTSDVAPTTSEGLSSEDTCTSTTAAETNRQPIAVEPKMAVVSRMGLFKFGKHKKSPPRIPGYQVPLEVFQKALKSKEWASAEEFLKHALNLYFTDVGGQPEFQEVLPAIIAGPSIFFIVFKLPDRLDQKYRVQYVESLSRKSVTYESSFTVLESILQSLASIASMCSYVQVSRNNSKLVPIKPKVVLVGTHKDQADAKHIRNIQRELKEQLRRTDHVKEGIIVFASDDEPALTINNLSKDETDAAYIRQLVEKIARDPAFTISVPAPWLALLLSLRLIDRPVISYDDCLSMAKDCGIDGDEELKEALWFLHTKLGVIRYFGEIPELSDIVICDPQLIFDKITALISRTFTFEELQDIHASEEFRDKGIFPARIIDEISNQSNEPLSRKQLVILLKHLRVIAPIYKDEEQQDQPQESKTPSHYIVPCVLAHAPVQIEIESTSKGKKTSKIIRKFTNIFKRRPRHSATESTPVIPSVCILFKCGYCPKGMFGALIADLMSPAGTRLRWRLLDHAIYRDQVSFHVGPEHHTVRITFFISFLEVCISADTDHARSTQQSNAKAVCNKIRRELEQSLVSVSRTLNYGPGAGIYFGFHSICSCSTPAKCDEVNPVVMKCDRCGLTTDLQDTHKLWFGEEVHVSIDDLEKMLSAAWEARAKWYNIGLQLKIGAGTLDAIERDSHSIDDQFRVMLSTWLRRDEPRPTLSLLANALRSPMVGYQHLAQQILAQY